MRQRRRWPRIRRHPRLLHRKWRPSRTRRPWISFVALRSPASWTRTTAYNFNTPAKPCTTVGGVAIFNCLRNFDVAHNSFSLNLAEIAFEKKPTADSRGGFRVDLDYGATAALVAGFEPGGTVSIRNPAGVRSYLAPTGTGLQLDFGKFVTPAGNEVIETKDNWNYSRGAAVRAGHSVLPHGHARPRTAPNDKVTVTGYLVNGWNNAVDNNTGKTVIGMPVTFKPTRRCHDHRELHRRAGAGRTTTSNWRQPVGHDR